MGLQWVKAGQNRTRQEPIWLRIFNGMTNCGAVQLGWPEWTGKFGIIVNCHSLSCNQFINVHLGELYTWMIL